MSILLEGTDNSGKTTLSKDLRQLNPHLQYHHSGSRPSTDEHERLCLEQQHALLAMGNTIVDRATCISEQVYRPDRLFEVKLMQHVDLLLQIGVIIVYCRPSTDKLMSFEKFTWRGEESEDFKQGVLQNQHIYIQRYDELMTRVPHLAYDYEDEMASAWLRKMLAESSFDQLTYLRLHEVMMKAILK